MKRSNQIVIGVIEEIFSYCKIPGAATASILLNKVFQKKTDEAREILLDEITQGHPPALAEDDAIFIIYRYLRSAHEGAARVNLRLLAQVISGKNISETLTADKFLYYADIISNLKVKEIKFLGISLREREKNSYNSKEELNNNFSEIEIEELHQSLLRTGLIVFEQYVSVRDQDDHKNRTERYISEIETSYVFTSLMDDVCQFISFDDAIMKESDKD